MLCDVKIAVNVYKPIRRGVDSCLVCQVTIGTSTPSGYRGDNSLFVDFPNPEITGVSDKKVIVIIQEYTVGESQVG